MKNMCASVDLKCSEYSVTFAFADGIYKQSGVCYYRSKIYHFIQPIYSTIFPDL